MDAVDACRASGTLLPQIIRATEFEDKTQPNSFLSTKAGWRGAGEEEEEEEEEQIERREDREAEKERNTDKTQETTKKKSDSVGASPYPRISA